MLVEHHIKYKELHGIDETIWMERSEHRKLHERLRKEGKCKVPVKKLETIANKAYDRTEKARKRRREYDSKFIKRKAFITLLEPYFEIIEVVRYNVSTNKITVSSSFRGTKRNTY
jgi:hypothetical protein